LEELYSSIFPFGMYFVSEKSFIHIKFSYSQDITQRYEVFLWNKFASNFLFGEGLGNPSWPLNDNGDARSDTNSFVCFLIASWTLFFDIVKK